MEPHNVHPWNVSADEAIAIQRHLAPRVQREGDPVAVRLIAGTDIAVGGGERPARAAVVVLRWPELEPVEQAVVETRVTFPYVPGLLSFRELPVLIPAFKRLRSRPDLVLVDGQGIAHPRRLGLASHLGLVFDVPAIGCAKSRLTGHMTGTLGSEKGDVQPLVDRHEVVGAAVRTRTGTNPLFISVGHRVSLEAATRWTLACCRRYRLPEPTRLAHQAAAGKIVAPDLS